MTHLGGGMGGAGSWAGRGLLPSWLGVVGALVFSAVLIVHLRHVVGDRPVPRRCWHWGHALMALSMVVMYLPAGLNSLHIPPGAWRAVFIVALGGLAAGGMNELVERRAVSALWLLLAGDMVAMLYMWSPGIWTAPLSAIIVAYLLAETGLWATGRVVVLDRPLGAGAYGLAVSGGLGFIGLTIRDRDRDRRRGPARELRVSMAVMALGMAYMILAMAT